MSRTSLVLAAAAVALLAFAPTPASAQVVRPTPSAIRFSPGRPIPPFVTVRWNTSSASTDGRIVTDEAVPVQVMPLDNLLATTGGPQVEQIPIPVDLLLAFAEQGIRLRVVRVFDTPEFVSDSIGTLLIELSSPLGGAFTLQRMQLRFDEGSPLRLLPLGSEPRAFADLSYTGRGELVAVWEVAEPPTTSGAPVFRPLRRVRRVLGAGQRTSLSAPAFPTDQTGLYLVRLRVLEPFPDFDFPLLRYYVGAEGVPSTPALVEIAGPSHQARLTNETVFRWRPVPGARAYRLELHPESVLADSAHFRFDPDHPSYADSRTIGSGENPQPYEGHVLPETSAELRADALEQRPIAGVVVPAEELEARLTPVARSKLEPGRRYVWIVRALAENGIPVGLSPARILHVPE